MILDSTSPRILQLFLNSSFRSLPRPLAFPKSNGEKIHVDLSITIKIALKNIQQGYIGKSN